MHLANLEVTGCKEGNLSVVENSTACIILLELAKR